MNVLRSFHSFRVAKYDPHNCDICNISCNSNAIYNTHKTGKKHQKAYEKLEKNQFRCDICNIICNDYDKWKKHQNSLEHTLKFQTNSVDQIRGGSSIIDSIDPLSCNICERVFDSNVILQSHLTGQRHKSNLRQIQLKKLKDSKDPAVYCKECDLILEPDNMTKHRTGNKHKKSNTVNQTATIVNKCLERCPICELNFDSKEDAKKHYLTSKHKDNVDQKADTIFWCDICKLQVQSLEILEEHFQGFKHFLISNQNNENLPDGKFKEKLLRKRHKVLEIKEKIEKRRARSKEPRVSSNDKASHNNVLNCGS